MVGEDVLIYVVFLNNNNSLFRALSQDVLARLRSTLILERPIDVLYGRREGF